jgi:hypothetical protein
MLSINVSHLHDNLVPAVTSLATGIRSNSCARLMVKLLAKAAPVKLALEADSDVSAVRRQVNAVGERVLQQEQAGVDDVAHLGEFAGE